MNNQQKLFSFFLLFSIVLVFVAGYIISNDRLGWIKFKGSDFFVQWLAVRTFAKEGLSPYMPVVQTTTEEFVYGHPTNPGEKGLKFSSPLYSVIVILPFALIRDSQIAWMVWMVLLEIALVANAGIVLRLTGWKPAVWLLFLMIVFSLLGFHNFQALASGSVIVLGSLFVLSSFLAIRSGRYELAGILLALATIQPRAVLLVILFVLFWAISKRLWAIVVWFFAGVAFLFVLGLFFIPDWPVQYARIILNFKEYYTVITPVAVFSSELPGMGRQLGWVLSVLMTVILIFEWLAARTRDFSWFLWTASLTLVVSQWVGIPADLEDFVLLLLPVVLVLAVWDQRFERLGKWMAGLSLVVLLAGLWGIFASIFPNTGEIQQSRVFLFPLPFFLFIGLYWVRWWAIRPQKDYVEELKSVERF